jgi:1-acyl-sn-glycerol-3-phosphate acyltransferase
MKQELDPPPAKQPQAARASRNLYKPYVTPNPLYQALRWFVICVFHLAARVRLRGLYNVPSTGAVILVANHLSWTDIPLIPMHLRRKVVYMAKEEYFSSRIAWLVRFLGAFPVKRGEGDRQALRAAEEQLKQGKILVIFPEGTRSRTQTMAMAHSGMGMIALRAGVPVVPVAICGSEKVLKQLGAKVTITYGEPMILRPAGNKITREDIDSATAKVMRRIAEMLPPAYKGVYAADSADGALDAESRSPTLDK